MVPNTVLIQSKPVPITVVRPVSTTVLKISVTRPRQAKFVVTKPNSPPRRHINRSPFPKASNSPPRVTAVKAPVVNAAKGLQGKWEWKLKCPVLDHVSRNTSASMTLKRLIIMMHLGDPRNMSYLFDFEEFNGRYVAFGGNLKGDNISGKGSGPTWLFDIDTLTKTMNYQSVTAGNQNHLSAGFQEQFDAEKAREEMNNNICFFLSAHSKKHDDKTKREAKRKSPVESLTGYRNLSAEFEDFSNNNINEVNATSTLIDAFQYPDDPDMPELEDITSDDDDDDDDDDVGAEADFNNLETSITVSPIPTTKVHKDHPMIQIISDLSLATQTRSMTRVAKDQGFEDPDHPDKVYKVVKALYGLHQTPRA
nr:reverse transcriptase [Tanacetum cinerariifolium]